MRPSTLTLALLSPLLLAACGEAPTPVAEPAPPAGPPPLTGPQFAAQAPTLLGQTVGLAVCSLDPNIDTLGYMECRVRDPAGADVIDAAGRALDIYLPGRELDEAARTFITQKCGRNICLIGVSGRLETPAGTSILVLRETVVTDPR